METNGFSFAYNMLMYESPNFTITKKIKDVELRLYDDFYTVAVHEPSLKGYSGFGVLFQYISGENQSQTKMKMTVPVINDLARNEQSMEFVIPKIHQAAIPQPLYETMKIKHYPAQEVLVKTFSGNLDNQKMNTFIVELSTIVKTLHYNQIGDVKIARYNGPFTLPFLRKNEIWMVVEKITDNLHTSHKV